jgi:hypothetical protein
MQDIGYTLYKWMYLGFAMVITARGRYAPGS